jgi:hypothetical protein
MVRALLDGSKTQTRRVVKPIGAHHLFQFRGKDEARGADEPTGEWAWCRAEHVVSDHIRCPYGKPGDRLWVRETFLYVGPGSGSDLPSYREERANPENHKAANCWYRASQPDETLVWTPSIHMPRWASRITLEVTGVRVERLQDITESDARKEGAIHGPLLPMGRNRPRCEPDDAAMRSRFAVLWDSLAAAGSDWDANPWVWVVEFKRVT